MALPKFKFVALEPTEYRVFNGNFPKDITVHGNLIEIGKASNSITSVSWFLEVCYF